jgi:hypothetical protein
MEIAAPSGSDFDGIQHDLIKKMRSALMNIELLPKRQLSAQAENEGQWRITLMRQSGVYPRTTIITPSSIFCATDDCVFMVAPRQDWPEELPYSEVMWLSAEEVRLLGSIMMTERFDGGQRSSFRPLPYMWLYIDPFPVNRRSVRAIRRLILETLGNPAGAAMRSAVNENPGGFGGCFPPKWLQIRLQPVFWDAISPKNYILLRAMHALIKSDMLALAFEFREEAVINTFIALDASFQLVVRHLQELGIQSPTARNAGEWLYKTFDERLGLAYPDDYRYFQEFYDNRIRTLHPGSRFGDFPYAPLAADDYSHLRSVLPGILGYLVTGTYTPEFVELFRRKARSNGVE